MHQALGTLSVGEWESIFPNTVIFLQTTFSWSTGTWRPGTCWWRRGWCVRSPTSGSPGTSTWKMRTGSAATEGVSRKRSYCNFSVESLPKTKWDTSHRQYSTSQSRWSGWPRRASATTCTRARATCGHLAFFCGSWWPWEPLPIRVWPRRGYLSCSSLGTGWRGRTTALRRCEWKDGRCPSVAK